MRIQAVRDLTIFFIVIALIILAASSAYVLTADLSQKIKLHELLVTSARSRSQSTKTLPSRYTNLKTRLVMQAMS
jgi:hypothetical protein